MLLLTTYRSKTVAIRAKTGVELAQISMAMLEANEISLSHAKKIWRSHKDKLPLRAE